MTEDFNVEDYFDEKDLPIKEQWFPVKKSATKLLKSYRVSEDVFDRVSGFMGSRRRIALNFEEQTKGPWDSLYYYFNKDMTRAIYKEHILSLLYPEFSKFREIKYWRYVVLIKDTSLEERTILEDIQGIQAWRYMEKVLLKHYSSEEIKDILNSYTNKKDNALIQFHYTDYGKIGELKEHTNCYKYDINSAHAYVLTKVFPKAKSDIEKIYQKRKKKPIYKMYLNYFVGYLKHLGYEGVYNYIVQETTKKLKEAISKCFGFLLYANTDGFIVRNPERELETSKELGDFKKEYCGTVWTYRDKNYEVFQLSDGTMKGNIPCVLRKHLDLQKRKVVHFDKVYKTNRKCFEYTNIEEEILRDED